MKTDLNQFECPKDVDIFVQTAQVLGAFLLMVGKRSDGRRVLLELFNSIIASEADQVDSLVDDQVQVELILELAQAAWLDRQMENLLTCDVLSHLYKLRCGINEETHQELFESLSIALYIIGAGLTEHNKMHVALDAGFEEDDFELDDFVNEKMSGSAEDFYRHSMSKVRKFRKMFFELFSNLLLFKFVFKGRSLRLSSGTNALGLIALLCSNPHVTFIDFDRALVLSKSLCNKHANCGRH